MAKGGTIEIEVELEGAQDIKEGLGSIGTAGKALAANMGVANEKLGEGLENVGESVFGVVDSFSELKQGISTVSQTGISGFTALLGPIGMVVTAGFTLYETFKLISGAAQEAEENASAMAAAASDLQSKLEALSEKGVQPGIKDLQKFSQVTLEAQFHKEKLQFAQEKLTKTFQAGFEAEEKVRKLRQQVAKSTNTRAILDGELKEAIEDLNKARAKETEELNKFIPMQIKVNEKIKEAEKIYKKHEETSAEFLKAKILENAEILKTLQLAQAENDLRGDALANRKIEIERINQLTKIKAKANEEDQKKLLTQHKNVETELKTLNQIEIANETAYRKQNQRVLDNLKKEEDARAKRRANAEKAAREAEAQAQREQAAALKLFAEKSRITQLEIQAQEDSTQKQINLATHRYVTQLQLAKDNLNQQRIAILQFNAELKGIRDKEAKEALLAEQTRVKQAQAFSMNAAIFNAQQIENNLERELELLRLNYEQKVMLAEGSELQINELTRRYAIDRQKVIASQASDMESTFNAMFTSLGRGMASAAYNAIFFSGSLKEATANIIKGLGEQAAVEALMQTAKGVAALANPFTAFQAPGFFKSAGIFAGAAALAGVTASAMGAGDVGGGGGLGGGASAMGSPQTAQAPQREEATSSSMVFNVNFSGAVVYDTRKAAEMALADRVTRAMNTQRRGAPRSRRS